MGSLVRRVYAVSFAASLLGASVALAGVRAALIAEGDALAARGVAAGLARGLADRLAVPVVGCVLLGASLGALIVAGVTVTVFRWRVRTLTDALERMASTGSPVDLPDPPTREFVAVRESFRRMGDAVYGTVSSLAEADVQRRRAIRRAAHDLSSPVTTLLCLADEMANPSSARDVDRDAAWASLNAEIDRVASMVHHLRALATPPDELAARPEPRASRPDAEP